MNGTKVVERRAMHFGIFSFFTMFCELQKIPFLISFGSAIVVEEEAARLCGSYIMRTFANGNVLDCWCISLNYSVN